MNEFPRKPGISDAEVVVVAEQERVVAIVVCGPIRKSGADR